MNPIDFLNTCQTEVLEQLAELEDSLPGPSRAARFRQMETKLLALISVKEEIFYPTVAMAQPSAEPLVEGYESHVEILMALEKLKTTLSRSGARFQDFAQLLRNHFFFDTQLVFPRGLDAISAREWMELGDELVAAYDARTRIVPIALLPAIDGRRHMAS